MKNDAYSTTNTLTFKFWLYFVTFAVSLFIILWFMQVIFLQSYYSSMKKNETIRLSKEIEQYYLEENFTDNIDNLAYKNASSIFIFDLTGKLEYTSSSSSGDSNLSQMPTRPITINTTGIVEKILSAPNRMVSYTLNVDRFNTQLYVYGRLINNDNEVLVIVTSIDPIDSTTNVLQSQLLYVTIIALLIASIISIFISKRLSRPIVKITETARKLAQGNYDIHFEKAGYAEVDNLADTLNFATVELARTDKVRKELIANVSHDLRTPLTMIKAYSEMIRDLSGENKEKREEHLKVIIDETDRLTRLVNDMMDLSKIESGFASLTKTRFNLIEVINTIVKGFSLVCEKNNIVFKVTVPNEAYVMADKTKIEQVIYNLVSNAINHSGDVNRQKEIEIKITSTSRRVKTQIIDNGIGISKEDLPHIWSRYYRASNTYQRASTGTGLGLSIVKNILDKHNSNYGVNSEEGKGTNFWFELEKANKK